MAARSDYWMAAKTGLRMAEKRVGQTDTPMADARAAMMAVSSAAE